MLRKKEASKSLGLNVERNLEMLTDFYEFTMTSAALKSNKINDVVVFNYFYRGNPDGAGYSVFAGLEQLIQYITDLKFSKEDIDFLRNKQMFDDVYLEYLKNFKFTGSIYAMKEGTIMFPNEPIIKVVAPWGEAQLIETMLLLTCNYQSLIATKASRIRLAAKDTEVLEFGARRAHGYDAANYGARAAYIGGVDATATTTTDMEFGVPAIGTMAHAWIQMYGNGKESEYQAFLDYAMAYPNNCSLLVDTFHVLNSGIPNAIQVAKEYLEPKGFRLKGIRLDSGDLASLSKKVRKMLDSEGMNDCKIIVSNSLDEHLIKSLLDQGAPIDVFGVGERLITSKSTPVFGGVYKMAAVQNKDTKIFDPRIKLSETIEKTTNPGNTMVWRMFDKDNGKARGDIIALDTEDFSTKESMIVYNPNNPNFKFLKTNISFVKLLECVIKDGKNLFQSPNLIDIKHFVVKQLKEEFWSEYQRFDNPQEYYVSLSDGLYDLKKDLLKQIQREVWSIEKE